MSFANWLQNSLSRVFEYYTFAFFALSHSPITPEVTQEQDIILTTQKHFFAEICVASDGIAARNVIHQPNFLVPTWQRTLAQVMITVKRASAPILVYWNSVCSFYSALQLIHDLELNPGPPSSLGKKLKSRYVTVTFVHLNVCSLASRKKFHMVKQTIVHDNYDIFVISKSWLDPSMTNIDI